MSQDTEQPDAEDRITRERREHSMMKAALEQIAGMVDPDDIEEDEDGFTEWGCSKDEAIPMAYENAIGIAQSALNRLSQ